MSITLAGTGDFPSHASAVAARGLAMNVSPFSCRTSAPPLIAARPTSVPAAYRPVSSHVPAVAKFHQANGRVSPITPGLSAASCSAVRARS